VFSNVNAKNGFFANAHGLEVRSSNIDFDQSNRDIDLPYHTVNHFNLGFWHTAHLTSHTQYLVADKRKVVRSLRYTSVEAIDDVVAIAVLKAVAEFKNTSFLK